MPDDLLPRGTQPEGPLTLDGPPPAQELPHPNVGWAVLWCIAIVLCSQVPGGIVGAGVLLAAALLRPEAVPTGLDELLASPLGQLSVGLGLVVAHGTILVLSLVLLRVVAGPNWTREVAWRLPAWHQLLVVLAAFPAFVVLAGGLYHVLRHLLRVPGVRDLGIPGMEELEKAFGAWPVWLSVLLIGVMPAFSEELWCRAFLGRGLVGSHGYFLGVAYTSLLFGAIHIDPAQGLMAAVMGVVLHTAYLWTRSLWVPMLMHFLNNTAAVLLARWPEAGEMEKNVGPGHWPLFACAGAVLVLCGAALWLGQTRVVAPNALGAWQVPFPGVACPPECSPTKLEAAAPPPGLLALLLLGAAGLCWLVWSAA